MTAAKLRDAEASNLEHLVTKSGEFGGRGKVTGRDRMKGQRDGIDLVDSFGDSTDGLLEGGGNPGIADPLDIIDFLNDLDGPQRVAFCLDISASMQVPIFVDQNRRGGDATSTPAAEERGSAKATTYERGGIKVCF